MTITDCRDAKDSFRRLSCSQKSGIPSVLAPSAKNISSKTTTSSGLGYHTSDQNYYDPSSQSQSRT
ncbi:unnamed protein product, partial [Amoebophrya sp. A25]|eukprot:GSA25T00020118001.1